MLPGGDGVSFRQVFARHSSHHDVLNVVLLNAQVPALNSDSYSSFQRPESRRDLKHIIKTPESWENTEMTNLTKTSVKDDFFLNERMHSQQ